MSRNNDNNPHTTIDPNSVWDRQVGGSHYRDFAIQPSEFLSKNEVPFVEGSIVKYVLRWRRKGGLQDLEKAQHYLDMLKLKAQEEKVERDAKAEEAFRRIIHDSLRAADGAIFSGIGTFGVDKKR